MELKITKGKIGLDDKVLNGLDHLVLDFVSSLDKLQIRYVLVSGYVSILFGRNRTSEDVDMIVEKMDFAIFGELWDELHHEFECLNTENVKEAYEKYLLTAHSARFSKKGAFIPNIEMKFPKDEMDVWTLGERTEVLLNNHHKLFISPLELQIPFKLFLGSEKDIEDARHLYGLFKDKIDLQLLREFNRKLKVERLFDRYLE